MLRRSLNVFSEKATRYIYTLFRNKRFMLDEMTLQYILQNLPYFWNTKTDIWKTTRVFIFQKYGKFWSVSLGHFINHKPLISEECVHHSIQSAAFFWLLFHEHKLLLCLDTTKCKCWSQVHSLWWWTHKRPSSKRFDIMPQCTVVGDGVADLAMHAPRYYIIVLQVLFKGLARIIHSLFPITSYEPNHLLHWKQISIKT